MSTTKLSNGLAFAPEKDLALFAEMAADGKHLSGIAKLGHGWSFADGTPEKFIFDLAYEGNPEQDYFDIFKAAGWTPVLSLGDMHIFRALPGTTPVHTNTDSRRVELTRNRNRYICFCVIALAILIAVGFVARGYSWNGWVTFSLSVLLVIPVVYTALPLAGYWHHLNKLNQSR